MSFIRLHRIMSVAMIAAMLSFFSLAVEALATTGNPPSFRDVTQYQKEIGYLTGLGIIQGYQDQTFRPSAPVKRLQAVQLILRTLGIEPKETSSIQFTDLKKGDYGYPEVATAVKLGIVSGKSDGSFDPYGNLTRGQMAKIFANAFNLQGKWNKNFTDVKQGDWIYEYVHALAANGITTGYPDGSFRPNDSIQRMHFAVFLARYINDDFKPPVLKPLERKEVIAKKESVVMINVYDENDELISQGSGFVTTNGLIITNYHVINGGAYFEIETYNGDTYELEGVVDYDLDNDIAILKPYDLLPLKQLRIGSKSMVEEGDDVIAIGSPLGLYNTVSSGIVSGIRHFSEDGWEADFIQFTAPVTFGNSGGPLLNMYGYVVGVVSFGLETGSLNFALAADHVKDLVSSYVGVPFYQLSIIPIDELPVIDDGEEELPEDGGETGDETDPPTPAVETTKFSLDENLVTSIFHPSLPILYGLDTFGNVVEINYETKQVKTLALPLPAERLYFANNELYITLLKGKHSSYWWEENQQGAIAILDTNTFTLKKIFDIALDPYDVVADDRYIYVSSGSGQWTSIKSYDRTTYQEVSSAPIRQASYLEMNPSKTMIYAITTDTSPRDIEAFSISDGKFTSHYDSPYHGDYPLSTDMTISSDGKYLFNHAGTVFYATSLQSTNMTYVTTINPFSAIAFDPAANVFYTGKDSKVTAYNSKTFEVMNTWTVSGIINHLFVSNGKLIMLTTETPYSSGIKVQSIQIFNPTASSGL
ncbi:S-layer homology domain-containing protein [Thermaerobacillus caldiproteolyticus]|uniref:S1-C subfamily serine protease n=1 Tax=Thermaerobacillus caldiproteolyticus TaxID=247480 RepID=A0A7V9Z5Y1_9BACL|nr:S-layer homology domain-containing protein [Anoxybacillus caldiproteolyticus]MBA2874591.1 S1-C subfamily serine protease [Anoxybacillus caldiproteolyticus]